jgi:hypothetical protein
MTDFEHDDELLARLRAADPAASLPPADLGRTARLLEDTMSHDTATPEGTPVTDEPGSRNRSPLTWLVAAAAMLVIAGVGAFAVFSGDDTTRVPTATDPAPTVMELSAHPPTTAMCLRLSAQVLANMEVAFDGTVTSIDDGLVTLDVGHWYRGGDAELVTVKAPPANLQALIQAASFEVGQRYLVSANDGFVSVCGFTAPYSDELAAMYAEAYAG